MTPSRSGVQPAGNVSAIRFPELSTSSLARCLASSESLQVWFIQLAFTWFSVPAKHPKDLDHRHNITSQTWQKYSSLELTSWQPRFFWYFKLLVKNLKIHNSLIKIFHTFDFWLKIENFQNQKLLGILIFFRCYWTPYNNFWIPTSEFFKF